MNKKKSFWKGRNTKDVRSVFSAGINYTLPMLIMAQAEVFTDGNFQIAIGTQRHSSFQTLANEFNVTLMKNIWQVCDIL